MGARAWGMPRLKNQIIGELCIRRCNNEKITTFETQLSLCGCRCCCCCCFAYFVLPFSPQMAVFCSCPPVCLCVCVGAHFHFSLFEFQLLIGLNISIAKFSCRLSKSFEMTYFRRLRDDISRHAIVQKRKGDTHTEREVYGIFVPFFAFVLSQFRWLVYQFSSWCRCCLVACSCLIFNRKWKRKQKWKWKQSLYLMRSGKCLRIFMVEGNNMTWHCADMNMNEMKNEQRKKVLKSKQRVCYGVQCTVACRARASFFHKCV